MNLFDAWCSGKTVRKHTMQTIKTENTAEHTWGALFLLRRYAPYVRVQVVFALLLHDCGEQAVGDLPAHVLWQNPELALILEKKEKAYVATLFHPVCEKSAPESELTRGEQALIDVMDRGDFVISCVYEYMLGSRLGFLPIGRGLDKISEIVKTMPDESREKTSARFLLQDLRKMLEIYEVQYAAAL